MGGFAVRCEARVTKCLVSERDYQAHFGKSRQIRLVGAIEPAYEDAPTVCIYCNAEPVDPKHEPYCSGSCRFDARCEL